jgi:cation transport ATPase
MQQRYYGLTLGQVYENRMRYGANVVNPLTTENWSLKLHYVSSFWLIKLLNFISLMAIFLLPLLDLLGVEMSIKIWSILLILPILLLVSFIAIWVNGHNNSTTTRYEVDVITIAMLLLLIITGFITYYKSLFLSDIVWKRYINTMIIAGLILLISLIRFLFRLRHRNDTIKKEKLDDLTKVQVIRDGVNQLIARKDIVVGDLICIKSGDIIAADAELLSATDLVVDEYQLTGQSISIKSIDMDPTGTIVPSNHVLKGSHVLQGEAIAEVFAVGEHTFQAKKDGKNQTERNNTNEIVEKQSSDIQLVF